MACVPVYPSLGLDNLGNQFLSDFLPSPYGWSSHTPHWADCLAAVRSGATVIEKHLALDDEDEERRWSLTASVMAEMVTALRAV